MGIPGWMAVSGKGATDVAQTTNDSASVFPQHADSEAAGGFTKLGGRVARGPPRTGGTSPAHLRAHDTPLPRIASGGWAGGFAVDRGGCKHIPPPLHLMSRKVL